MKIFPIFPVLAFVALIIGCAFWVHGRTTASTRKSLPINRDAMDIAEAVLLPRGRSTDPRELVAFGQCAELSAAILADPEAPPLIMILRPNPKPEPVSWAEFESAVRSGDIVEGNSPHSRDVSVTTRAGRLLTAKAPQVDALAELCREVDPSGVFIRVATE